MTEAAAQLAEFLADDRVVPEREGYAIGDNGHELNEAEWAMKKYAKLVGQRDDVLRAGHAEIEKIKAWMAGETTKLQNDIAYFENLLIAWHQERLQDTYDEAGGVWAHVKGKTCRLPSGVVSARMTPDRVEVTDEEAFLERARGTSMVRIKYEPDKPALLKYTKETGELLPGVELVKGDVTFKVSIGTEAKREMDE